MSKINNILELKNKNALITGATSGIGEAMVHLLAEKGVNLCLVGRNEKKLNQLKNNLKDYFVRIEVLKIDLTDEKDLLAVSDYFKKNFPSLDILIHSAGVISTGSTEVASLEDLKIQLNVNYFAPYILTKSLLQLIKSSKGQIVFVNSSAIQKPTRNLSQYTSSKFALKGFADALREEINADGVRIISIYPGKTATNMQEKLYKKDNKKYQPEKLLQPSDVALGILNALQLPMTAEITDIFIRPMQKS